MAFVFELSPPPHPLAACNALRDRPDLLFLDSAQGEGHSYLMADPWQSVRDPLSLRASVRAHGRVPLPDLPPFQGGGAGFIDYEWRGEASDAFRFGLYDWVIAWDHARGKAWLVSTGIPEKGEERERRSRARAEEVLARLRSAQMPPTPADLRLDFVSNFSPEGYRAAVSDILGRIGAGEVEQVNLSQRFTAPSPSDPWSLYLRLRALNPAPFAVFAKSADRVVVSASPERFFQVRNGKVESRPIKGTRPRGEDEEADRRIEAELRASEKDRRENRMIAELLADELSSVCEEVRLAKFCRLEKQPTVQHLVSVVEGALAPGRDPLDLLLALFPGASITGRPKRAAMEIISELEDGPRGAYCGSAAWWSHGGDFDSNVLIRTFVIEGATLHFSVGGGIVAGSRPDTEWEETMHKARALLRAAGAGA